MKFHQVTIGQAFIYQAKTYIKLSPVLATSEENGEQCFMRRANNVQLVSDLALTTKKTKKNGSIDIIQLTAEFDEFLNASINALKESVDDLSSKQELQIVTLLQQKAGVFYGVLKQYNK